MKISDNKFTKINGGITAPCGYLASGISSGIKKNGAFDLALLFSKRQCTAAGVFTKNKVKGHSLVLTEKHLSNGKAQCVLINSGNANACIGPHGTADAVLMAKECAKHLNITPEDVLVGSTGVIGHKLPIDTIIPGIRSAVDELSSSGGTNAASAIMTTDTYLKEFAIEFILNGKKTVIGGMAKGSGMIHPDMATMISVMTTDAKISSELLKKALIKAVSKSFNKISVDGETSVCDKVLLLANGCGEGNQLLDGTDDYYSFIAALTYLSILLSKSIISDGEGATKLIEINIFNAKTLHDAETAAKAVANSPLVKTAFYGEDANWGRILTAIGYSGADFNPLKTTISIGPLTMYEKGVAIPFDENIAKTVLKEKNIFIKIDFNEGVYNDTVWTCDFSHGYIDINAHYRT